MHFGQIRRGRTTLPAKMQSPSMVATSILIPLYTILSRSDMQDAGHKFSLVAVLLASCLGISHFFSVITTSKALARVRMHRRKKLLCILHVVCYVNTTPRNKAGRKHLTLTSRYLLGSLSDPF